MTIRAGFAVRIGFALSAAAVCGWNSNASEGRRDASSPRGGAIQYQMPGGENFFALSLTAPALAPAAVIDHVVLVDTSASQTGDFRTQSLHVLEAALSSMRPADRVRLFAVDLEVRPLMSGFAAPQSDDVRSAVRNLQKRVPLGATSLAPALESALAAFAAGRDGSVIYIGDGMSTARLIESADFRRIVEGLRARHIPVNSYAIGPRTDLQLLGALAAQTGGTVLVDETIDDGKSPAEQLGRKLAAAAAAPVFYPGDITVRPEVDSLLPSALPPLRGDRDTIVLGKGATAEALEVSVRGTHQGKTLDLNWTIRPAAAQAGNVFLSHLWSAARRDGGLSFGAAGTELLTIARQEFDDHVQRLVARGERAVMTRDLKQAEQIAWAIRQADPANVDSQTILAAAQKVRTVNAKFAKYQEEKGTAAATEAPAEDASADEANLLAKEEELRKIRGQRLSREVKQLLEAARKMSQQDPDSAIGALKRQLNTVLSATDVDPDVREINRRKVQGVIEELTVVQQRVEQERIRQIERQAGARARFYMEDQLVQRDEKLEQLIDKVRSLMNEGFLGNDAAFEEAEAVSRVAWELAPYSGTTAAAIFDSEAAGQLDKAERLRYLRADMFLAMLHQTELSHVPFPDEPPIVYPAPEVWKALTERRRKWASVDLMKYNAAEEKIRRSLDTPTDVDWVELPLEECIQFLQTAKNINIWIDRTTIADEGVGLDTPVTLRLAGVTLRSVLKLLLGPSQLTWIIEDEVMKITTAVSAGEKLSTRVYPVADLVIPIVNPQAGGLGQGLGGVGGIGGGGGLGGGGVFNVADEPPAKPGAARDGKKKM